MKSWIKFIFLLVLHLSRPLFAIAQQSTLDDLKHRLRTAQNDSIRYNVFVELSDFYQEKKLDSALFFIEQCLSLARKNNKILNVAASLDEKGLYLRHKGQYSESLQCYLEAFELASDPVSEKNFWALPMGMFASDLDPRNSRLAVIANLHMQMANLFIRTGNNALCVYHFAESDRFGREAKNNYFLYYLYATMSIAYRNMNKLDSAMIIALKGLSLSKQFGFKENVSRLLVYMGEIYFARSQIDTARKYYHQALPLALDEKNFVSLVMIYFGMTKSFMAEQEKDSSLYYCRKSIETLNNVGSLAGTIWNPANAYENLFRIHSMRDETDSANKYLELTLRAKDSLNNLRVKSSAQAQDLFLRDQIRMKDLEKEKIRYQNKVRTYAMLAGIGITLLLAIFFYLNNKQKQKAKIKIEKAYEELKLTQAQLIQREKMATLGELTAGIAHEIQNPLNFVNNFSEVSNELMDDVKNHMLKGNHEDARAIVDDVKENLERIIHHGKRADEVVKGMLQHSRLSSGKRELTDINALCAEYLKLAYHACLAGSQGFQAKDNLFDPTVKTELDQSIGKINVTPQDISRVIVNLASNAFYAVNEKRKLNIPGYEATVSVITRKVDGKVEISIIDNGIGIPQKILDKIFQPFFTTKPAGQGTGLGLSLAYDIVTKGHGGEIRVETKEGEGSEFVIQLPNMALQ